MSVAGSNFISDKFQKILLKPEHRTSNISNIPSPLQWIGGSIHQTHKAYYQKCTDTKSDMHVAILHMKLFPVGPGLPNSKTSL